MDDFDSAKNVPKEQQSQQESQVPVNQSGLRPYTRQASDASIKKMLVSQTKMSRFALCSCPVVSGRSRAEKKRILETDRRAQPSNRKSQKNRAIGKQSPQNTVRSEIIRSF